MTYARFNPSGYSDGQQFPAAAYNYIDSKLPYIIDTQAGGSYAFGGLVVITGTQGFSFASTGNKIPSGGILTAEAGCSVVFGNSDNLTCATYTGREMVYPDAVHHDADGADWVTKGNVGRTEYGCEQQVAAATSMFSCKLPLSRAATVTQLAAKIEGAAGHGGELDADKRPVLQLISLDINGAVTVIDYEQDTTTVAGGYENKHALVLSGLSQSLDTDQTVYMARMIGEYGPNSMVGLMCYSIEVYYTVTTWSRI